MVEVGKDRARPVEQSAVQCGVGGRVRRVDLKPVAATAATTSTTAAAATTTTTTDLKLFQLVLFFIE